VKYSNAQGAGRALYLLLCLLALPFISIAQPLNYVISPVLIYESVLETGWTLESARIIDGIVIWRPVDQLDSVGAPIEFPTDGQREWLLSWLDTEILDADGTCNRLYEMGYEWKACVVKQVWQNSTGFNGSFSVLVDGVPMSLTISCAESAAELRMRCVDAILGEFARQTGFKIERKLIEEVYDE